MIDTKEQLHQRLKDIKTQLRLSMNGAVSQSMREKGLVYKLNFGVELPRIKYCCRLREGPLSGSGFVERRYQRVQNIGGTFTAGREFPARDSRYLGGRYP